MGKNVTLNIDEDILKQAKLEAVNHDLSLSQWLTKIIIQTLKNDDHYEKARRRSLKRMQKGFPGNGTPIPRNELYEDRLL